MRRKSVFLVALTSMLLFVAEMSAQRPSTSSGGRGTTSSRTSTASSTSSTSSVNSSGSRNTTSSYRSSVPSFGRPTTSSFRNRGSSGGGTSIPVQTYTPGYKIGYGNWIDCMNMLQYLSLRYSFLPYNNYMWRYAQGDSALTQEAIELALLKPVSASSSLMLMSRELSELIDQYEAGQIDRNQFQMRIKSRTKAIRNFAKTIRKDYFLDTFDKRDGDAKFQVDKASSIPELRQLCESLRVNAVKIDEGLTAFYEQDMSRTVSVTELQRPSFESLTKGIDKIAKTIEKSAKRL